MSNTIQKKAATLFAVVAIALSPVLAQAQATGIDQAAVKILQKMTDYMGGLKQFSVHTQVTYEDELTSGQRVDYDVSAIATISRPDKFHSKRSGELLSQTFYYDGKNLTLFNQSSDAYATQTAPGTIDEMLRFAHDELGLFIPASDLVYENAFPLLMEGVNFATVVGKTEINGRVCHHLAFSRPDVDFQVWVGSGEQPLACKYVVTDTATPARLSVSTVMSDWNTTPTVQADSFTFVPPENAQKIEFLPLDSSSGH